MIQPIDLRIGNLVYGINRRGQVHLASNEPLKIIQVGLFNCECVLWEKNPAHEENWFNIANSDLSAVPISETELRKLGFTDDIDNKWLHHKSFYPLSYNKATGKVLLYSAEVPVLYVHQIQNIWHSIKQEELTYTP